MGTHSDDWKAEDLAAHLVVYLVAWLAVDLDAYLVGVMVAKTV